MISSKSNYNKRIMITKLLQGKKKWAHKQKYLICLLGHNHGYRFNLQISIGDSFLLTGYQVLYHRILTTNINNCTLSTISN